MFIIYHILLTRAAETIIDWLIPLTNNVPASQHSTKSYQIDKLLYIGLA